MANKKIVMGLSEKNNFSHNNEDIVEPDIEVQEGLDGEYFTVSACKFPRESAAQITDESNVPFAVVLPVDLQDNLSMIASFVREAIWRGARVQENSGFVEKFLREKCGEIKRFIRHMDSDEEKVFVRSLWRGVKAVGATEEWAKNWIFVALFPSVKIR